jgi:hypothetical protein
MAGGFSQEEIRQFQVRNFARLQFPFHVTQLSEQFLSNVISLLAKKYELKRDK